MFLPTSLEYSAYIFERAIGDLPFSLFFESYRKNTLLMPKERMQASLD